jgi:hypothetical protein
VGPISQSRGKGKAKALFALSVAKQERGFAPNPTKGRGPLETISLSIN